MVNSIKMMQGKFKEIQMLIGNDFTVTHLQEPSFVQALVEVVEETYILLNEEMCNQLEVCHQCASHRDVMQAMVVTLNDILDGVSVNEKMAIQFAAFPQLIDDVITRTQELYEEYSHSS